MAGLVAYASSDEEEDVQEVTPPAPEEKTVRTQRGISKQSQTTHLTSFRNLRKMQ
jgi:hypothetical protein